MSSISPYMLGRIKDIPILDVATRLGLKVKGKKTDCYNGHDKNSPSLTFYKIRYKCFGCGDSGDSIELVQKVRGSTFIEACGWLSSEFNITTEMFALKTKYIRKPRVISKKPKVEESEYRANSEIYEWIIEQSSLSKFAANYLIRERGFSTETIESLAIKDIQNPDIFFAKLKTKWGIDALMKCGLLRIADDRSIRFVWWDHVLLFPFKNLDYRIDYLQARRFASNGAKYLNLANVAPTIYNLSRLAICKENDDLFICEGIPDTITAIERNFNGFGILGANGFKEEWVEYFKGYNVSVIPDTDEAGKIFVENLRKHFKKIGKSIRVIELPKTVKDLNEFHTKGNN